MSLIAHEIYEIKSICQNVIKSTKIITCIESLVRIDITQSDSRQLTACLRFPENYPNHPVLVELKSKTLSTKLLDGLTTLCEQKAKEILGKPQIMFVLKFIDNYLTENPLCIVFDEIAAIKAFIGNGNRSEIKLRQKTSSISITITGENYYFKIKALIPKEYPSRSVTWDDHESNLPIILTRYLNGQAREIARQCIEAPLRTQGNAGPFQPKPSLERTITFLIAAVSDFPKELCPICKQKCLPETSEHIQTNDTADNYIERVYCGHLYHQGCLKRYIRQPPFPVGGKLCPALKKHPRSDRPIGTGHKSTKRSTVDDSKITMCAIRLSHDRWGLNIRLAEARWAQQQARERELEEVIDFMQ